MSRVFSDRSLKKTNKSDLTDGSFYTNANEKQPVTLYINHSASVLPLCGRLIIYMYKNLGIQRTTFGSTGT